MTVYKAATGRPVGRAGSVELIACVEAACNARPTCSPAYGRSVTFTQYYGAAPNESIALSALRAVGAETWALAQVHDSASSGTPNTFIWGYRR